MKIGLYFGSFNPIHTGHLIIANHVLNLSAVVEIWIIVSPQNPFKAKSEQLAATERFKLVQAAIAGDARLQASDVEFGLSTPSYTINTLDHLKSIYPAHEFMIIMGSDSVLGLNDWKEANRIRSEYHILVYKRPGYEVNTSLSNNIQLLDAPLLEISSTTIRALIAAQQSIRYLVPEAVRTSIEKNGFYKK
jgi:nicotinate-nucleotide adenylyltransferase